jgi:hypothetical protein
MKKPLRICVAYRKDFPRASCIYGYFREKILFRTAQITKLDSGYFNEIKWINLSRYILERVRNER